MSAAYRSGRGTSDDPGHDIDGRLAGLESQVSEIRSLLSGTAGRSLEDRVTAIERLLVRLEAGLSSGPRVAAPTIDLSDIEKRVASIEGTLVGAFDRLAERIQADLSGRDRLEEVREVLTPAITHLGERLAHRLDAQSDDGEAIAKLGARLDAIADRVDGLSTDLPALVRDAQARLLDRDDLESIITPIERLREDVAEVASTRPDPRPELAALTSRLDELSDRVGQVADAATVEEQGQRLTAALDAWRPTESILDELTGRLAGRDTVEGMADRISEAIERLRERLGETVEAQPDLHGELVQITGRLDALYERITRAPDAEDLAALGDRLSARLEAGDPTTAVTELQARLDSLARSEDLASLAEGLRRLPDASMLASLGSRLESVATAEALEALLERVTRLDPTASLASLRDRVEELGDHVARRDDLATVRQDLADLAAADELVGVRAEVTQLAGLLEGMQGRIGRLPDVDDLSALGDRLTSRLESADAAEAVAELQERVGSLARSEDLARLAEGLRRLPDAGVLAALESRLEAVATAEALEALLERVSRLDPTPSLTSLRDRVDELSDRIARRDDVTALRQQVADLARAEDLAVLVDRLARPLAVDGLQGVEDRLDRVLAEMREQDDQDVVVQLERLRDITGRLARAEDVEALIELVAGIDGRTQHVATSRDVASVRDRVADLERGLGQLDVSEAVLAFREELDRVTTTLHEARRDVAQLAAGDISDLRDRVAGLATSSEVDLLREDVTELVEAVAALNSATSRVAGADAALTAIRERVEGLEGALEARTQSVLEPLDDLHDLVASRTDALLQPGRIQAALAPIWEGIATVAEDLGKAREAAADQQGVIDDLRELVGGIERLTGDLAGRVKGEEEALTSVVRQGVSAELDDVVTEVRKLGASYHRVATDLGEQVQRLRQTSDEVVGSLQRRDRMLQDEVVERLVTALDQVVDLGGRSRRKIAKGLADAAADGAARAGEWEQPEIAAGPTRLTLRREDDESGSTPGGSEDE